MSSLARDVVLKRKCVTSQSFEKQPTMDQIRLVTKQVKLFVRPFLKNQIFSNTKFYPKKHQNFFGNSIFSNYKFLPKDNEDF